MRRPGYITIYRTPEGENGAGDSNVQSGDTGKPAEGGQPSGGAGDPNAGNPYRPEGLPDDLFGASDKETIDKLFGSQRGLREAVGKFGELGKLPKDADGYAIEVSDKLKPYLPELDKDPVWKAAREAAHKAGIRDKQFPPFVTTLLEAMVDGEMVLPSVDLAAETAKLVPADAAALDEAGRKAAVQKRVGDNHALIESWKSRGLPAESAEQLGLMLDTYAGNAAIEFFAQGQRTQQPGLGGEQTGGVTEAEVKARLQDPRHRVGDPKFEQAWVDETNRLWKVLYPETPRA